MIYVDIGGWYIGVNHIILVKTTNSEEGDKKAEVIYGFSKYTKSFSVSGMTAPEVIESVRKQIKEQLKETPELAAPFMEPVSRFDLMEINEENEE